jgi:hypothetical protein
MICHFYKNQSKITLNFNILHKCNYLEIRRNRRRFEGERKHIHLTTGGIFNNTIYPDELEMKRADEYREERGRNDNLENDFELNEFLELNEPNSKKYMMSDISLSKEDIMYNQPTNLAIIQNFQSSVEQSSTP